MAVPTSAREEDRGRWKSLRGAGQQVPVALFSAEVGSPAVALYNLAESPRLGQSTGETAAGRLRPQSFPALL